jgi:hypothetical protein
MKTIDELTSGKSKFLGNPVVNSLKPKDRQTLIHPPFEFHPQIGELSSSSSSDSNDDDSDSDSDSADSSTNNHPAMNNIINNNNTMMANSNHKKGLDEEASSKIDSNSLSLTFTSQHQPCPAWAITWTTQRCCVMICACRTPVRTLMTINENL